MSTLVLRFVQSSHWPLLANAYCCMADWLLRKKVALTHCFLFRPLIHLFFYHVLLTATHPISEGKCSKRMKSGYSVALISFIDKFLEHGNKVVLHSWTWVRHRNLLCFWARCLDFRNGGRGIHQSWPSLK